MKPQILVLKGFLLINLPILLLWLALPIVGYMITKGKALPFNYLIISMLVAFIFTWVWWSITSISWQIKALNNTKYPVELEHRASKAALIFERSHFFQQKRWSLSAKKQSLERCYTNIDSKDKIPTIEFPISIRYNLGSSLWFLFTELANFLFLILIGLFLATNYSTGQLFSNIGFGIMGFATVALFINAPFVGKIDLIAALLCCVKSVKKEEIWRIDKDGIVGISKKQMSVRWEDIHKIIVNEERMICFIQKETMTKIEVETRGIDTYKLERIFNQRLNQDGVKQYGNEIVSVSNNTMS